MTAADLKPKTWTIDEYHRLIDAGLLDNARVELLNGQIIEMPPENPPHAYQSQDADRYLARLLESVAEVRQAKPITLPNNSEPEPDIAVVRSLGREYCTRHPYPPDILLLIEYSDSTINRDLSYKLKIYAEARILEYWVVDIQRLRLIVHRDPVGNGYASQAEYQSGTIAPLHGYVLASLAFPDIAIDVLKIINP